MCGEILFKYKTNLRRPSSEYSAYNKGDWARPFLAREARRGVPKLPLRSYCKTIVLCLCRDAHWFWVPRPLYLIYSPNASAPGSLSTNHEGCDPRCGRHQYSSTIFLLLLFCAILLQNWCIKPSHLLHWCSILWNT